jgi:hypothetical protein
MTSKRLFGVLLATLLGAAATTGAPALSAQNKPAPVLWSDAPSSKKAIALPFPWLRWGMSHGQIAKELDRVLENYYRPLLKKAAGVEKAALTQELKEAEGEFRRSKMDFGNVPTALDATYYRGEYSYNSGESVASLTYKGDKFKFFFFQDKLWKVMVESKLEGAHVLGKSFPEAMLKLGKKYGTGRTIPADVDGGRWASEVDWKDNVSHLRVIEIGETSLLLAYEDVRTLQNLSALRAKR